MSPKIYGLTRIEKKVLLNKYKSEGLDIEECYEKIANTEEYLKGILEALKSKDTPSEEIDKKFKEEFYKLCGEINYE